MRFLWYQNHSRYGGYQPQPTASADNPYWLPLSILDIIKTEGNNCFIIHWTNSSFLDIKCTFSKIVPTLSFPQVLSVFSISRNQQTAPFPPSSTSLCFVSPCLQLFFRWLAPGDLLGRSKPGGSHVFASSLTASNTKRANLTWLPLEIEHRGHTWLPVTLSVLDMIIV